MFRTAADPTDTTDDDLTLLQQVRAGDTAAYGCLFARHREAGLAAARRLSRSDADADDLLAEGSARVLAALLRGGGPEQAYRAYLFSTIRRLAYDRTDRGRRELPTADDPGGVAADVVDPVLQAFECATALAALRSLPPRWQTVLWQTEVEDRSPADLAELLGLSPNATAALAYRAREGLRQAYLTLHAAGTAPTDHECRLVTDRLAAFIRGGLSEARRAQVAEHLGRCEGCRRAHGHLTDINDTLRSLASNPASGASGGVRSSAA